jgi:hypothetical protein
VTGANNHIWEREHRHPTSGQLRAMGYRRRDAETKLEQHQQEARLRAGDNTRNRSTKAAPGLVLLCDSPDDLAGDKPVDSRQVRCPDDPSTHEALGPIGGQER